MIINRSNIDSRQSRRWSNQTFSKSAQVRCFLASSFQALKPVNQPFSPKRRYCVPKRLKQVPLKPMYIRLLRGLLYLYIRYPIQDIGPRIATTASLSNPRTFIGRSYLLDRIRIGMKTYIGFLTTSCLKQDTSSSDDDLVRIIDLQSIPVSESSQDLTGS